MVDSREVEVDHMEKVVDLIILCRIKVKLSGKMKIKERPSGKVVVPTKEVVVHTEEEVIIILELVFMVNVIDVVKKVIDPLNKRIW